MKSRPSRTLLLLTSLWLVAMAIGLWLDAPVARLAHRAAIDRDHFGNHVLKMAGDWRFTLAVALALIAWHRDTWRPAGLLALAGCVGGLLYTVVKWTAGRQRPLVRIDPLHFSPFVKGWQGFVDEPNLSFPSGHTCLAFATAATLALCLPRWRWRWVFYPLAAIVGIERVAENAHYVTDVIAGAGLGILSAYLTHWTLDRLVDPSSNARMSFDRVPRPVEPVEHEGPESPRRHGGTEALPSPEDSAVARSAN
jgi:membrane-associated phospholipid phosphatase